MIIGCYKKDSLVSLMSSPHFKSSIQLELDICSILYSWSLAWKKEDGWVRQLTGYLKVKNLFNLQDMDNDWIVLFLVWVEYHINWTRAVALTSECSETYVNMLLLESRICLDTSNVDHHLQVNLVLTMIRINIICVFRKLCG